MAVPVDGHGLRRREKASSFLHYQQGRFPFDRLVRYYELGDIEQALADSASGEVVKPILRVGA